MKDILKYQKVTTKGQESDSSGICDVNYAENDGKVSKTKENCQNDVVDNSVSSLSALFIISID